MGNGAAGGAPGERRPHDGSRRPAPATRPLQDPRAKVLQDALYLPRQQAPDVPLERLGDFHARLDGHGVLHRAGALE